MIMILAQLSGAAEGTVTKTVWTPEMLTALSAFLLAILGGVGKLMMDLRSVSKQNTIIHSLVNSRMTLALSTIARLARSLAVLSNRPEDVEIANDAEKALAVKLQEDAKAAATANPFGPTPQQKGS